MSVLTRPRVLIDNDVHVVHVVSRQLTMSAASNQLTQSDLYHTIIIIIITTTPPPHIKQNPATLSV